MQGKPTLYAKVFDVLRGNIRTGRLGPGDLLLEAPLARLLHVSRAPVRRALRMMEAEGLVGKVVGRGFVVRGPGRPAPARRIDLVARGLDLPPEIGLARAQSLWQRIDTAVEREIASRIVFGRFQVIETRLARHYGVSRTVAREVLGRLQKIGLVEQDAAARWQAGPLTLASIRDHYVVRRLLEPAALAEAAPGLDRRRLAAMRVRLDEALERYPAVPSELLDDLEKDLHVRCVLACHNRQLAKILALSQLLLISNSYLIDIYRGIPDDEPFLEEHRRIFDCLLAGEPEAAAAALADHLISAEAKSVSRVEGLTDAHEPAAPPWLVKTGRG